MSKTLRSDIMSGVLQIITLFTVIHSGCLGVIASKLLLLLLLLNLKVGDKHIKQVNEAKLLGIIIDESITWDKHIYKMSNKISKKLGLLKRLKTFIPSNMLIMLFNCLVLPHFDYANVVWGTACGT